MSIMQPRRHGQPWQPEEHSVLFNHWGEEPLSDTAGRVGRTVPAVRVRLRKLIGTSSALQGRDTVESLARDTGYDWHTIRRAMKAMGLRPGRTNRKRGGRGQHMLQERHREAILEWLGRETAESAPVVTVGDVARRLDVPQSTAYDRVARAGLATGPLDDERQAQAAAAVAAEPQRPITIRTVARRIRANACTAYAHAARVGIGTGALSDAEADYLATMLWMRGLAA